MQLFVQHNYCTQWTVEGCVLAPSVCGFLFVYFGNRWTDLHQIHVEDVFGSLLGWVWRSKVKVTGTKKQHFLPFGSLRAVCVW